MILFNLCGHGHFDMAAYSDYFARKLTDRHYSEEGLAMALSGLPSVPAWPELTWLDRGARPTGPAQLAIAATPSRRRNPVADVTARRPAIPGSRGTRSRVGSL